MMLFHDVPEAVSSEVAFEAGGVWHSIGITSEAGGMVALELFEATDRGGSGMHIAIPLALAEQMRWMLDRAIMAAK